MRERKGDTAKHQLGSLVGRVIDPASVVVSSCATAFEQWLFVVVGRARPDALWNQRELTVKNYTANEVKALYTRRHEIRKTETASVYGEVPYANYGYWPRENMTVLEACDAMSDLMAKELALCESDRVLECGCGYGVTAAFLSAKYHPQKYIGLDVTDVRIEEGRLLLQERGLSEKVTLQIGDATNLDFPDATFTKIFAIECAFHFDSREDFLKEAFRVLTPGGILVIADIIPVEGIDLSAHTPKQICEWLSADAQYFCKANIYNTSTYKEILRNIGFADPTIYSIKDKVIPAFSAHLEQIAKASPPDACARRMKVVNTFRTDFMTKGDYVVAKATKP
ncbi:MAG: methyltransferase domain-containing protein [Planctomycetota bacterium]